MPQASMREEPWFVQAFGRLYLRIYPHRGDAEAEQQAGLLCRLLGVRAHDRVLDVACGAGRHARALGRRGMRVTGVDLSEPLLSEARSRSPGTPGSPTYLQWDIRDLPFQGQFDGAISIFTSFGYFDDAADDQRVFRGVERSLLPRRRFVVDYLNTLRVRSALEPLTDAVVEGLHVRMERWIDEHGASGPRVHKWVRAADVHSGLELADYEESVRLYTLEEIDGLAAEAGLLPHGEPLGGLDGSPFGPDAARVVRVYERRA